MHKYPVHTVHVKTCSYHVPVLPPAANVQMCQSLFLHMQSAVLTLTPTPLTARRPMSWLQTVGSVHHGPRVWEALLCLV